MKINVGIVGYGNLGKAIEEQIQNNKIFNLIGIFSRRNLSNTTPLEQIVDYKNKIDVLFLCGGSQNDLEIQATKLIKHFNTIDCYDNHNRLESYVNKMNSLAKTHNKVALCAFGWDPGLFSLMRGLFSSLGYIPNTFWGKGTSQGHTQAIKQIDGVIDAIQFTVPNPEAIEKTLNGMFVEKEKMHTRECYVVCEKQNEEKIKNQIINMPDYFKGYSTHVSFVSQEELNEMKTYSHKGTVLTKNNTINFSLNIDSNPNFTANIMINFAKSIKNLINENNFGAYTIYDIATNNIMEENKFNLL